MTNKVALKFVDNKSINMVCPLGLSLGIKSIIGMAMVNDKHIALNGCPIKYASKALESAGIKKYEEITLKQDTAKHFYFFLNLIFNIITYLLKFSEFS